MEIRFFGSDFQASEWLEEGRYHGDAGRLALYQISNEAQKI